MNDPNGMVYDHGEYHLFYQYNPHGNKWGPMHWGHAISRDLLYWESLPIALFPDRLGAIFSGSAVADPANSAGFGSRANPALVAMYTYHDQRRQDLGQTGYESQGLAYSLDRGRSWATYSGNPVLANPAGRDFRDPKVFWHAPTGRWLVVLAAGDHVAFYSSRDLRHWSHESDFGSEHGAHDGVWECPDLISMPIEGTSRSRYVLLVSIGKGGPNGGSATQYFVGDFDGHRFTADAVRRAPPASAVRWLDYGTDDYAGSTWSGGKAGDTRRLFIGWMSNWQYAADVPTQGWRSAMTLPRELRLVDADGGPELRSRPVAELAALRRSAAVLGRRIVSAPLGLTRAAHTHGGLLELDLDLDIAAATGCELLFANARGEHTTFRINAAKRRFELDRSASGAVDFSPKFTALQSAPWAGGSRRLRLRIYLDQSSIEVFVNDGETVLTALVFPATPYDSVVLRGSGTFVLNAATVYELGSIWR
ncbi:MAG: glycoside hydrolase family 32 protein [Gammaproteobacteria bacterium]|nr:glycoside hydrolase family 32 protein [Gammaproteobacteria bacterium]